VRLLRSSSRLSGAWKNCSRRVHGEELKLLERRVIRKWGETQYVIRLVLTRTEVMPDEWKDSLNQCISHVCFKIDGA
jgi:hypothetical protein